MGTYYEYVAQTIITGVYLVYSDLLYSLFS